MKGGKSLYLNAKKTTSCFLCGILLIAACKIKSPGTENPFHGDDKEETTITFVAVTPPPPELGLDSFYRKYIDASGIPVIGSEKVPDEAFIRVRNTVNSMLLKGDEIRKKMIGMKIRVVIMAVSELTKDIPEYSNLADEPGGRPWNDCRGIGATAAIPFCSCAEENVLCYGEGKDPYFKEDILVHEFAHSIHELGIALLDTGFDPELEQALGRAKAAGLWKNTYAGSSIYEYFAEGVQSWFNVNAEAIPGDGISNEINTREELKNYDPVLYEIIKRYFDEVNEVESCHRASLP